MKNLPRLRWIVMIASFIVIVFGAHIFGAIYENAKIPVLACGKNLDQFVGSSCYYLSHINELFEYKTVKYIIIFFAIFIVGAIIIGRMFCGFVCPMGLIQDIIYEIRQALKIKGYTPTEKTYQILKILKYEILALFLGGAFFGFDFCNICPAIITSTQFGGYKHNIYIASVAIIIVFIGSFFKRRFWCNICPMGYLVGLFSKVSIFRLKKDCTACTECRACYEACPMGIKSIYTEREKEDITTTNCIMCGECVKKCPEDNAIYMSVLNKKFYVSSRFDFFNKNKRNKKKKKKIS